uniref:Ig-like domain-containing protein n=1 Tax=Biomphalaria glabrata TaxID=6526 RepID=A0A2C9KT75_BIOGL
VPIISLNQTNVTFIEATSTVTLACNVTGYPPVTLVYWEKDQQVLNTSALSTRYTGSTLASPSLTILNISRVDAGTYSCVATNSEGTRRSSPISVTVNYPPDLTVDYSDITKILETTVTLTCVVSANPAVTYFHWLKDDILLDMSRNT